MVYLGEFNEDENEIKSLKAQLAASKERERILREGLKKYSGCRDIDGNYSVSATLKTAEEVKG